MKDPSHRLELAGRLALEKVEVVECEKLPRARRPHSCVVNTCDYHSNNESADHGGLHVPPLLPTPVVPTLLHPKHVIATLNRERRLMTWSINPGGSVRYLSSYRLNLNPHRSSSSRSQYHYDYRSTQFSHTYQDQFSHHHFHSVSHSHHPTEMISVGTSLLLIGDNLGNVHLISYPQKTASSPSGRYPRITSFIALADFLLYGALLTAST